MEQSPLEDFEDWDFVDADTQYMTHGLHPYPARMIPQIARRLIKKYSEEGNIVLDPFCGSGTVLVEAKLANRNSIGVDINPFALLLSRVKTTPLNPLELKKVAARLFESISNDIVKGIEVEKPQFFNIDFWFKPYVIRDLAIIKRNILKLEPDLRDFFLVSFALTVRKSSNTRNSEFKLFRLPPDKLKAHKPNVYRIFEQVVKNSIEKMKLFYEACKNKQTYTLLLECDAKRMSIPSSKVDLIVTSPPYGDSKTTVAYGQFSRLASQWIGFDEKRIRIVDKESLGGKPQTTLKFESPTLEKVIKKIKEIGSKERRRKGREREVISFYNDLFDSLVEMCRVLKDNGHACIVIGNRTVCSVQVPTDKIIQEMCNSMDFVYVKTIHRSIPYKTMPIEVSPSNVPGEKERTMTRENIIILKKS